MHQPEAGAVIEALSALIFMSNAEAEKLLS
jgi:hypothetical protein